MTLFIDALNNAILVFQKAGKKGPGIFRRKEYSFPLNDFDNQKKAIADFLTSQEGIPLFGAKNVDVVLSDLHVGYGSFELPSLSHFKVRDAFETRFKLCYPQFQGMFVHSEEYERTNASVMVQYEFAQKKEFDEIIGLLRNNNVSVANIDYFSSHFIAKPNKSNAFPQVTLVMGLGDSEVIISKGNQILCTYFIGYGTSRLDSGLDYISSPYFMDNELACRFAGYTKGNFASRSALSDDSINRTDPESGLSFAMPKETRILRGESLENYYVKNGYRKLVSIVTDIMLRYSDTPYFIPSSEIKVIGQDVSTSHLLEASKEYETVRFIPHRFDLMAGLEESVGANPLFNSGVKKERRRFDWSKFLTMEIGGGRKKA